MAMETNTSGREGKKRLPKGNLIYCRKTTMLANRVKQRTHIIHDCRTVLLKILSKVAKSLLAIKPEKLEP